MAPEIIKNGDYGKSVDIWACGVILYILLTKGQRPICQEFSELDFLEGLLNNIEWIIPESFSPLEKNLFENMMKLEPVKRYTTREILAHPWVTGQREAPIPKTCFQALEDLEKENLLRMYFRFGYFLSVVKDQIDRRNAQQEKEEREMQQRLLKLQERNVPSKPRMTSNEYKKNTQRGDESSVYKNFLDLHSIRDKLATAIELDRTISKGKKKGRKFTPSPHQPDSSKEDILFTKAPSFQKRNELLLKRAEQFEQMRLRNKLQTPSAVATPKVVCLPPTSDSNLRRMADKRRFTVHVKIKDDAKKKQKKKPQNLLTRENSESELLVKSFTPQPEVFREYQETSRNSSSNKLLRVEGRKQSLQPQKLDQAARAINFDFYSKQERPISAKKLKISDKSHFEDSIENSAYGFSVTPSSRLQQSKFRSNLNFSKLPPAGPQIRSQKELEPGRKSLVSKRDQFLDILGQEEGTNQFFRRASIKPLLPSKSYRRKQTEEKSNPPSSTTDLFKTKSYRGLQLSGIGSQDELSSISKARNELRRKQPAGLALVSPLNQRQKTLDYFKKRIN